MFENNVVVGRTIEDVWRDSMWCCIRNGIDYKVEQGSYVGQIRRQLPYLMIRVEEPGTRPLAPRMPELLNIPPTTTEEKIFDYFLDYLLLGRTINNEDYTYGQYIAPQLLRCIDHLKSSGGKTNQACIQIGDINSIELESPPCLRVITFKVVYERLYMSTFFRSWDLFAGLPQNLGGLQLLKEYVLAYLDSDIDDGPLIAYSDGLHIYEQYFDLVNLLNVDKIRGESG